VIAMSSTQRVAPASIHHVDSAPTISRELTHACAGFGVIPIAQPRTIVRTTTPPASILQAIREGHVVLITGASGAGKSSLLRGITGSLSPRRVLVVPGSLTRGQQSHACFDLLEGDAALRAQSLALAGLAEPKLRARPAGVLSVGEQARLRLAMTMHIAHPGDIVIADELASPIDRACAYALCKTITRWVRKHGVAFVGASAHEDLESMLAPDVVIDVATSSKRDPKPALEQPIRIEPGTMEDYASIAHLHYRSGPPATIVRVMRAMRRVPRFIDPSREILAGVLVVSMPTLNGGWRDRAWAGVFPKHDKRRNAHLLNEHIRTISRVIVEPRSRGLGVATQLVRAYLDDPLTQGTEASAAMGEVCPFFERAGMTPYVLEPDIVDTRLLDALTHLDLPPAQLVHTTIEPGSLLMRELISWGKMRKLLPSGSITLDQVTQLTSSAACRLCSRPRAYAYTKGERGDDPDHNECITETNP
jgi:ABC-type lipoprotein export system ATPase subunit/GNAT superfamily N-acetyltransferase